MQHRLLIRGKIADLGVAMCISESGSGLRHGPLAGMMQAKMPGACAAHREAAQNDAIRVDFVPLLNGSECFKKIDFAGPAVRHISSSKRLDLNVILSGQNRPV